MKQKLGSRAGECKLLEGESQDAAVYPLCCREKIAFSMQDKAFAGLHTKLFGLPQAGRIKEILVVKGTREGLHINFLGGQVPSGKISSQLMWRADSLEKTLMLGKSEDKRGPQTMRWLDGITNSMDMLSLFSCSVMSDSLWPHGLQHARPPCPSPSPGACSDSCQWCHATISTSLVPFSCLQSSPASRPSLVSQFFASGGQSVGASASASVLLVNIQDWVWANSRR